MPTKIEWTDETWNPIIGCTKKSDGCRNCYALRMAVRLAHNPKLPDATREKYASTVRKVGGKWEWSGKVALFPERLIEPVRRKKPTRHFVPSMSDLFHEDVPFDFIAAIFGVMALCPNHTFQVLTKRPQRALDWFDWIKERQPAIGPFGVCTGFAYLKLGGPHVRHKQKYLLVGQWPLPNVWLGVTAENQATADERIPLLLRTPAAVRFVSCEPLLEAAILQGGNCPESPDGPWPDEPLHDRAYLRGICGDERVNWVIVGGESGPGARPMHPDWARGLRDQAQAAGVPFFFKQQGAWEPIGSRDNVYCKFVKTDIWCHFSNGQEMRKVGKKAAGRLLDGRTWDEMPEVR